MKNTIENIQSVLHEDESICFCYNGTITQKLIAGLVDIIENEITHNAPLIDKPDEVVIICIELLQNIAKYSKNKQGFIALVRDTQQNYSLYARNLLTSADKEKVQLRLQGIQQLSKDEINKQYKTLRRESVYTHDNGAGIGFYEIVKRCETIDFNFTALSNETYYFNFIANINRHKER